MAEMGIASRAADLGAAHEPPAILMLRHGAKQLGQPVPDSNFADDENNGAPQQTHA